MKKALVAAIVMLFCTAAFAVDEAKNDMLDIKSNEILVSDLKADNTNLLTAKKIRAIQKAHKREVRRQARIEKRKVFFEKMFDDSENNQVVAAILAFFLGALGIHRVYLGGSGLLILLYIITLGGFFGIIPLIDFIRLIIGHVNHYVDNDDFFAAFKDM